MSTAINFAKIIPRFDAILKKGLCKGIGSKDGQMCIEAAICVAMGLPFGDEPECVATSIRNFKVALNDRQWSSNKARARALRNLGIAQIGSKNIVKDEEFLAKLSAGLIQKLIPVLFRKIFADNKILLELANKCEQEPTISNCRAAAAAAEAAADTAADTAAYAATYAATYAAYAAATTGASSAAYAAAATGAAAEAADGDKYLILVANIALDVLKELKSPGCEWI